MGAGVHCYTSHTSQNCDYLKRRQRRGAKDCSLARAPSQGTNSENVFMCVINESNELVVSTHGIIVRWVICGENLCSECDVTVNTTTVAGSEFFEAVNLIYRKDNYCPKSFINEHTYVMFDWV